MPSHLGSETATIFLKEESHKLSEEFDVEGLSYTITLDAALVTANTVNGSVGGVPISQVTFATDSDTTLAAVAAAIAVAGGSTIKSASVTQVAAGTSNDRVIVVIPTDQQGGVALTGFAVTNGASQAGVVVAAVDKRIYKGMPVEINPTSGRIQPLTASTASTTLIGYAWHDGEYGELCTVVLLGIMEVYAIANSAITAMGPVTYSGYDATTKLPKVDDTGVTATNMVGWTMDLASIGEKVRVIYKG